MNIKETFKQFKEDNPSIIGNGITGEFSAYCKKNNTPYNKEAKALVKAFNASIKPNKEKTITVVSEGRVILKDITLEPKTPTKVKFTELVQKALDINLVKRL